MKDKDRKSIETYAISFTKTTKSKLNSSKSSKDKKDQVDVIAKQLSELDKKVTESIEASNKSESSDSDSVIKLEFDKLNNRLDIIEAKEYARQVYTLGLFEELSPTSDKEDESTDSLIDKLSGLFDGDGLADLFKDGITGGAIKGVLGKLGGFLLNPYVAIPLVVLASVYGLWKAIEAGKENTHESVEKVDTVINGTTKDSIEGKFIKFSNGKTLEDYMNELSDPNLDPEQERILREELKKILDDVRAETAADIGANAADPSSIATTETGLAVDAKSVGDETRQLEWMALKPLHSIAEYLFGEDKEKLYSESISTIDMSAIGSTIYGKSLTAMDSAQMISEDYGKLSKINYNEYKGVLSDFDFTGTPLITEFNYSNPLKSFREIAVEVARLTHSDHKPDEARVNQLYTTLFNGFSKLVGMKDIPNENDKNTWITNFKSYTVGPLRYKGTKSMQDYAKKVYDVIPSYSDLYKAYFSKEYQTEDDAETASKMTIYQQCQLLGVKLDSHSKIKDIKTKFYFLPIKPNTNSGRNLNSNILKYMNSMGITKAYKIESGHYGSIDIQAMSDAEVLNDNIEAQNTRMAFGDAADSMDLNSMILGLGSYSSDRVVMAIIDEYSGITDKDKQKEFAQVLEKYSYSEIQEALNKKSGAVWDELLKLTPDNDAGNLKDVLKQLNRYQNNWSNNKSDIIEYYNETKSNGTPELTSEIFDKIISKIKSLKSIRDAFMEAKNKNDIQLYDKVWGMFIKLGIPLDPDYPDTKSILNRIFNYYRSYMLYDEGENDIDAYIHNYIGVAGYSVEDLSSTANLFGLGTADELKEKYGFNDKELIEFLEKVRSKEALDSGLVANEDGSFDQVYYRNGYNNNTDEVKVAVREVLEESKIAEGIVSLLESQGLILDSQSSLWLNRNTNNSNNNASSNSDPSNS